MKDKTILWVPLALILIGGVLIFLGNILDSGSLFVIGAAFIVVGALLPISWKKSRVRKDNGPIF